MAGDQVLDGRATAQVERLGRVIDGGGEVFTGGLATSPGVCQCVTQLDPQSSRSRGFVEAKLDGKPVQDGGPIERQHPDRLIAGQREVPGGLRIPPCLSIMNRA